MTKKQHPESTPPNLYSTFWRWHFYAGLFCIPFAIWLSITGTIYLFKPQVDAWIDSPYDHLIRSSTRASPTAAVQKAIESIPGSVLHAYELPESDTSALRVMVGKGTDVFRVYLHPETLEVLRTIPEEDRLMKIIFHLHGDLLLGDRGSMLMELAASWMIVLILTGLYLWWPRGNSGLAGTVYPRLDRGGRAFWRDLHSVTGLWVAFFLLFLLVSGLPWAKSWGGMLKEVRKWSETTPVKQDWSTGKSSEMAERLAANTQPAKPQSGEHKGHADHGGHNPDDNQLIDYTLLNTIVEKIEPLELAPPVLVTPPSKSSPKWVAKSDAQNRPLRVNLKFDNATGDIIERKDFSQRALLDRIIGTGVAAHEGQLFGWPNQLLGVFTTMGVILVSVSSFVMWWSRKPQNALGAPRKINARPVPLFLWLLIVSLGTVLPLMGISLIVILIIEFIALKRIKSVRHYLGLSH